jgi:hypothetical protein
MQCTITYASLTAFSLLAALGQSQAQNSIDWQTRAGGKMALEAASVKPSKGAYASNLPLTPWDDYAATNGLFRATAALSDYIQFAYELWPNELQSRELSHLPKWVATDRYSIEARAATRNPAKYQMRLMVQSLLADRFQLTAHFDAREVPVLELRLAKAGQPGPKFPGTSSIGGVFKFWYWLSASLRLCPCRAVGQTIVFCGLSGPGTRRRWQTTKNDRPPHCTVAVSAYLSQGDTHYFGIGSV